MSRTNIVHGEWGGGDENFYVNANQQTLDFC
jgi:hypothetical protein